MVQPQIPEQNKNKWLRKENLIPTGSVCAWTHQLSLLIDSRSTAGTEGTEREAGIPDSLATSIDLESHTTSLFNPTLY